MTKIARRKLQGRMRKVSRQAAQAKRKHMKLISAYRKLQKKYRAA